MTLNYDHVASTFTRAAQGPKDYLGVFRYWNIGSYEDDNGAKRPALQIDAHESNAEAIEVIEKIFSDIDGIEIYTPDAKGRADNIYVAGETTSAFMRALDEKLIGSRSDDIIEKIQAHYEALGIDFTELPLTRLQIAEARRDAIARAAKLEA